MIGAPQEIIIQAKKLLDTPGDSKNLQVVADEIIAQAHSVLDIDIVQRHTTNVECLVDFLEDHLESAGSGHEWLSKAEALCSAIRLNLAEMDSQDARNTDSSDQQVDEEEIDIPY